MTVLGKLQLLLNCPPTAGLKGKIEGDLDNEGSGGGMRGKEDAWGGQDGYGRKLSGRKNSVNIRTTQMTSYNFRWLCANPPMVV